MLVITPAMPMAVGLSPELREELGNQYIDVGIAEEQAVAMASGAAKNGAKPLVVTNMTFIQRTYDQISQDVCINNNPVTILLNYTALQGLQMLHILVSLEYQHFQIYLILVYSCPQAQRVNILICLTGRLTRRNIRL